MTTLLPSKISSSCPPTVFVYVTITRLSRARVASISSRDRLLPPWKGEALMLTITSAPALACSLVGPSESQMSSQTFTPTTVPFTVMSGRRHPGLKYRLSSKTP